MKKEFFRIKIHSLMDIITNSSTEFFIINKDFGLEYVSRLVKEKEKEFPCHYDESVSVHLDNPEYYEGTIYGCDTEQAVKYLKSRGYTVIPPEIEIEPEEIIVSCESGCMSEELKQFITETFNTEIDYR